MEASEKVVLSMADMMGWVGGLMAAAAYVLVARGRVAPDSVGFHAVNVAAAALLAVAAFDHDALPSAVFNLLWIVFGGMSVLAAVRTRSVASTPRT